MHSYLARYFIYITFHNYNYTNYRMSNFLGFSLPNKKGAIFSILKYFEYIYMFNI